MRFLDLLLGRPKDHVSAQRTPVPARIPAHERRQLAEAQVRIPAKWKAFDDMIRDYDGQARLLGRHR